VSVGDPQGDAAIGPVVNGAQFKKIQGLINKGIDEGATLVAGGPGRPEGLDKGYYVKPTVFANVTNDMTIAREEIFVPVMTMIAYQAVMSEVRTLRRPERLAGKFGRDPLVLMAVWTSALHLAAINNPVMAVSGANLALTTIWK